MITLNIGSSDFLAILARRGGYIVFERGAPLSRLKRDLISLKDPDGRDLVLMAQGYSCSPIELPRAIFDDFCRASLIRQDGPADEEHRLVFRLTDAGLERGLSAASRIAEEQG